MISFISKVTGGRRGRKREGGRGRGTFHVLVYCSNGPAQSQKPGTNWVAEVWILGIFSTAFSGTRARSWIGSTVAETQTSTQIQNARVTMGGLTCCATTPATTAISFPFCWLLIFFPDVFIVTRNAAMNMMRQDSLCKNLTEQIPYWTLEFLFTFNPLLSIALSIISHFCQTSENLNWIALATSDRKCLFTYVLVL